jgi:MYXO-CTERM domain-containing protein
MRALTWLTASLCLLLGRPLHAAEQTLIFDGDVPDDGASFFWVPFDVPSGIVEIEVRHDDLSTENIIDWGLFDPQGFRGYGGGNTESAVVGLAAASRSYLPGPLPAGTWRVLAGKAKIVETPARYHIEVVLRDAPTLAPQTERRPYRAATPLATGRRWYAGDLHVHSRESGDARPPLDEIASFARARGLDFVALSDHNTTSQLDFIVDAQARHPNLLLIPSVEFTTYAGHANGFGATRWVDHKIGFEGATIAAAARAFAEQGAVLSINHPAFDLGPLCIGCAWKHEVPPEVGAVEIATVGYRQFGMYFGPQAIAFWDELSSQGQGQGRHLAAVGGSDDHKAGQNLSGTQSPIGSPTTMVYADALDAASILAAIRAGRTVVKLQDPTDPMVDLTAGKARIGDTVRARKVTLEARVTGGQGTQLRLVKNGAAATPLVDVNADPFTFRMTVTPQAGGAEDRWRAEIWGSGQPRTISSHLFLVEGEGTVGGCSMAGTPAAPGTLVGLSVLLVLLGWRRARRRSR